MKNEESLERPLTDVTEMEVDVPNKRAKSSAYDKKIITLEDDEEESINQLQRIVIEEERAQELETSQPVSSLERIVSQVAPTEQQSKAYINIHHFTFDQVETSLYQSREDMVKKFYEERNLSLNENFKLMQEARGSIP